MKVEIMFGKYMSCFIDIVSLETKIKRRLVFLLQTYALVCHTDS